MSAAVEHHLVEQSSTTQCYQPTKNETSDMLII